MNISATGLFQRYPDDALRAAEARHRSAEVEVAGTVAGPPSFFFGRRTHAWHEAFAIVSEHGVCVEVVDNVDLAPRIPVQAGDIVAVKGQFVPTPHGGIIHDTHHQPGPGWHEGGWIEWRGQFYS